jgi:hypothetical protein
MGQSLSSTSINSNELPSFLNEVLAFCDWSDRLALPLICRKWRNYSESDEYFHWLCICLVNNCSFYIPYSLPYGETWKKLFSDFYPYRNVWKGIQNSNTEKKRFKVNVYARFRPAVVDDNDIENEQPSVTLPLHQRLHLIRISRNVNSNREALKILKDEGNWFGAKWTAIEKAKNKQKDITSENSLNSNKAEQTPLIASVQNIDPGSGRVMMIAAGIYICD